MQRVSIVACLVFSGFTALVYQLIWTRLLGFSFGTSTEAVSTVLAVFFAGLAIGNLLAARLQARIRHPLRAYALLELLVGGFALLSLPLLQRLHGVYALLGVPQSAAGLAVSHVVLSALVLLPPTIAMGATLPVVARGLIDCDESRGRWSAILYAANTLGAVLGAHLCGFWLIPELGLSRSVLVAGALNLAVAGWIWRAGRRVSVPPLPVEAQTGSAGARPFLVFFGVSGFVAIGYEIVWSKIFGIVMEGTLFGFAAVLSGYLLGIALGSFAIARRVDRIRDLPRAFALLHVAIGIAVVLGLAAVPWLPWAHQRLEDWTGGGDAVHSLYLLVLPIVLVPTALFGAAFPILVRLYTDRASGVGRGVGIAMAVNTGGSILASFVVGFWWVPSIGADATVYLLLMMDFAVAIVILCLLQESRGRVRVGGVVGAGLMIGTVALSFGGIHLDDAIAGRQLPTLDAASYVQRLRQAETSRSFKYEGKASIVTVRAAATARLLRTNGLPEAGFTYTPPHYPSETVLLGALPWLATPQTGRALAVGLGGANTLRTLLRLGVPDIEVVELEEGVVRAVEVLHRGRQNPLDDPRITLRVADGRNHLLLGQLAGHPGYDLIASQPSHPWRVGAANLFTEDFFGIAREALTERGVFATWLNGFRMDEQSVLAMITSFERVFPGSILVDVSLGRRGAFLLLGGRSPIRLDADHMRKRLEVPEVASLLTAYGLGSVESLLALVEAPTAVFARLAPELANTDDNALVETRVPRIGDWRMLDYASLESRLADDDPVLPPVQGTVDVAAVARWLLSRRPDAALVPKIRRLLANARDGLTPFDRELLEARLDLRSPDRAAQGESALRALADQHPARPEPLRALGRLRNARGDRAGAGRAFAAAHARSEDRADACAAGLATHAEDPIRAAAWFAQLPDEAVDVCPALPQIRAEEALARGVRGAPLRRIYAALAAHLQSDAGAALARGQETASRVAWALGDESAARAHADRDTDMRRERAAPLLRRARAALAGGERDVARRALDEAAQLVPSNGVFLDLRVRLALQGEETDARTQAFSALRRWAPRPDSGVGAENRLRSIHGLELVAEPPIRTPEAR